MNRKMNEKISTPDVTLADVKGIDDFKQELENIICYLRFPEKFIDIGAKVPKGVLLEGPPGVGKTLIAKALAGESECNFKYINGSELEGVYVGEGAKNIRKLFKELREVDESTILFIDEFDSIGGKRTNLHSTNSTQLLNQLLTEMDGFKKSDKIIIIASTNFASKLDPAVMRSGRFDKKISIPYPAMEGRKEILEYYIKKTKSEICLETDLNKLASRTAEMTGSDLKNFVNIATLNAIKHKRKKSTIEDFDFALDRMRLGISNKTMDNETHE
jgi:ATP-dependent metalloprotease